MQQTISTRWWAALTALVLAGSAMVACGDGLEEVLEGDLRCSSTPCDIRFPVVDVRRSDNFSSKVTITNVGGGDLQIFDLYIENSSSLVKFKDDTVLNVSRLSGFTWRGNATGTGFTETNDPIVLGPQEVLEFELQFGPARDGVGCDPSSCGTVVVRSNDRQPDEATLRVPISLNVSDGLIALSPDVLNFPVPEIGRTYTNEFRVNNTGTGELEVREIALSPPNPDISVASTSGLSLPITIAGNGQHEFRVTWTPSTTDSLSTALVVSSNDANGNRPALALRSGDADAPVLTVSPCGATFSETAVGSSDAVDFDIGNTGGARMNFSMTLVSIEPPNARTDFSLVRPVDGGTENGQGEQAPLDAGNTRTYRLVYTPTEDRAVRGQIRVSGNFAGTTRNCEFSAGPASPSIDVLPRQLYWGGLAMGDSQDRSFVVGNQGNAELVVSSVTLQESGDAIPGEFTLEAGLDAGFRLGAGEQRRITVNYTRAAADVDAADLGTVLLASNDPTFPTERVNLEVNHGGAILPPTCVVNVSPAEPYTVGTTVTFDATSSTPADGSDWAASNRFAWNLVRPGDSSANLSTGFGDTTSLSFDAPGRYEVGLTATAQVGGTTVSCELIRNLTVNP